LYDGLLFPAKYRFYWDGKDKKGKEVTNGEYFITVNIGDKIKETRKVIYLGRKK
jgi:flagellar hook assembly protein FlgD